MALATDFLRRRLSPLAGERGFTLVELMSAMLVTGLGIFALITTLDTSRELITFSEKREAAVHVAEREIERIQARPYAEVALTGTPTQSGDSNDPAYYVTPGGSGSWYRWNQERAPSETQSGPVPRCSSTGGPAGKCEQLVVNAAQGQVSPSVSTVTQTAPGGGARITLHMQRFVTWGDDPCVACTDPQDYKRVTVAVKVAGNPGNRLRAGVIKPVVLTTIVSADAE